jgi:CheY-like chemotaxis protein
MTPERHRTTNPQAEVPATALLAGPTLLVFHINDSTDDQVLFQAACKSARVPMQWHVAESAARGITYLRSLLDLNRTQSVRWPDLILLDLIMPGDGGFKVLEFIRAESALRLLPVIIFTGHPTPEHMEEAYKLGANSFLVKPNGFHETVKLVRALYETWSLARRPRL